jgi:hypothetical protein
MWARPDDWPNVLPHVVTHGPIDPYLVGQAHFGLSCLLFPARRLPARQFCHRPLLSTCPASPPLPRASLTSSTRLASHAAQSLKHHILPRTLSSAASRRVWRWHFLRLLCSANSENLKRLLPVVLASRLVDPWRHSPPLWRRSSGSWGACTWRAHSAAVWRPPRAWA